MNVYVRAACVPAAPAPGPALLLEGSWPRNLRAPERAALDDWLRPEHSAIDLHAEGLAEALARPPSAGPHTDEQAALARLADRQALALRYYLVKLLRVAAFCAERPFAAGETVRLRLDPARDHDYAAVLLQAALRDGATLQIEPAPGPQCAAAAPSRPAKAAWRRVAGRAANWVARRHGPPAEGPRTLLCGTPHVLDSVCGALLGRGHRVAWLTEQFVWRIARQWAPQGVPQLLCAARAAPQAAGPTPLLGRPVLGHGLDLRPALQTWFDAQFARHAAEHDTIAAEIDRRLEDYAPHAIVVDEDATPLKRMLLRAARQRGTPSLVVQHGVPCVRFGFAPLIADQIAVWGEASRAQLCDWGIPGDRAVVCGCTISAPRTAARQRPTLQQRARQPTNAILLLATVPPRADRPDSVAFGLSVASHAALLQAAGQAAARRGLRLLVRLHPRTVDADAVLGPLAQVAGLEYEVLRGGDLCDVARSVRCVLSCASSSGVQAAAAGAPVIQLLPAGGADLLPASAWGLAGTARTPAELEPLLAAVLGSEYSPAPGLAVSAFAAQGAAAAERVVDALHRLVARGPTHELDNSTTATIDGLVPGDRSTSPTSARRLHAAEAAR